MMASILNTLNIWLRSWHIYIGKVTEDIEEKCANDGEHTEHTRYLVTYLTYIGKVTEAIEEGCANDGEHTEYTR